MTTNEMIKDQLSENLSITIEHESGDMYSHGYVRVEVYFCGEVVASDTATIYE